MSCPSIEIADAVVAVLNGASLGQPVSASRAWILPLDLESPDLTVVVIPDAAESTAWDLAPRTADEWDIGIWIVKRVLPVPAEVDPLMDLADEIMRLFHPRPLPGTRARCVGVSRTPPYDPTKLDTHHEFRASVVPKFRLVRDAS